MGDSKPSSQLTTPSWVGGYGPYIFLTPLLEGGGGESVGQVPPLAAIMYTCRLPVRNAATVGGDGGDPKTPPPREKPRLFHLLSYYPTFRTLRCTPTP